MFVTTEALVLSKLNYSETSLIVRCYTRSEGIKSYILKGIKSGRNGKKNTALFQPLTQLEITAQHKNKAGLSIPKTTKLSKPYQTIPYSMDKLAVVLFLSEVLNSALREEEANASLFEFLIHSLAWFDTHDYSANFHVFFLISLSKHLGFYPDVSEQNLPYFDLENGCFTAEKNVHVESEESIVLLLKSFLGTKFDGMSQILMSSSQRQQMLDVLMRYYQCHLQGFSMPKSLNVLHEIYS
ncbi:MAG: DNA repair protein RecO [Flavobacteriaceae bacterium]|jgi:DNA repair protein RecO (recombination protein O)|nr:DNA repair protein RecO [Flavobacteriaceae bacterium]MBT7459256.1 DNA repair protein RecO [Flavobacteriaceae bacterium]